MNRLKWYKRAEFLIPSAFVIGTHIGLYLADALYGVRIESDLLIFLFFPEIIVFFMVVEPISAWYQYTGLSWFWLDTVFWDFVILAMAFAYGWIGIGLVNIYRLIRHKYFQKVDDRR
ncbi:MAG: hypothetical protein UU40_C0009G0029 [Candidatus Uhrbacteria bacterium GW2011_GWD2_41_121]|uniref:Uncharacterized protein n=1 Tax=Candidatus Uhrbacteria bacterium GW2011_GWC1_41_20 TaxID=1618983 RepID=A0A0G0XQB5_9BACT|nr:MAG: hypothetical protein UT52_C0012G0029 [Candidatus Uhrbacteria bacterium GW2011_GWE1_39_46]KKR63851.1 MAG: hypothetical protein UU04_C0010G0008 [Candidatus Uhrbacteria bacterium GW2011_GWC2_40_450]KKR90077.1 MAG: hypothetical protein UU40_C0009G0029 [Candidatus Uhrbacteria bacterium GW2011_GWD2_41_121]KKR96037.1 MAG: hypothetical protein UU46_C0009G0026 [Candidatus Uhrbacteria bacterium GW2011_GWD1_41_16]KKR99050.1 MAG: hypothetical protein UU50_C0011G0029 [Candidatus Uhrbacteria bacteriu